MTIKSFERRTFLKLVSTGLGGAFLALSRFSKAFGSGQTGSYLDFSVEKPKWILHGDGTFDLLAGAITLRNCRPSINGQSIFTRNTFMGDSPKGKRIIYELNDGFIMLDLKVYSNSISIGAEISGMKSAPTWFSPLGEAKIEGAKKFFRQGLGTSGPSGVYDFPESGKRDWGNNLGEENWSYDSYMTSALIAENGDTLAMGAYDVSTFIQRTTIYNKSHRSGLGDANPDDEVYYLESGFITENLDLKDDFVKLPDLFIINGNQPYFTLHQLAWEISEENLGRKDTSTNYQWNISAEEDHVFSYQMLVDRLRALDKTKMEIPFRTVLVEKGYCIPGDWFETNDNWPKKLDDVARQIFQRGFRAGIWVAPFLIHENSKTFRQHPNWILKDKTNTPIVVGEDEFGKLYAMDGSHEDAISYLTRVFRSLRKIGFTYFELDHLDIGLQFESKVKRKNHGQTSIQVFRNVISMIREEIGAGSFINANRTPYAPLIGLVDSVRIGNNVEPEWTEKGVGNMVQESYYCQYFNTIFWQNNNGLSYLRDYNISLNEVEKRSLAFWNCILGGTVTTNDNIARWSAGDFQQWKFLYPQRRPQAAILPYWGSDGRCKVALRRYEKPNGWGLLIFNDSDETVGETFYVSELIGLDEAWLFRWEAGFSLGIGLSDRISITLSPHDSKLYYLSSNRDNPPLDLTLGGYMEGEEEIGKNTQ